MTKPPACSPSEICNTITGNCEASLFNPPAKSENRSKFCDNGAGINTALGCIPISSQGFINSVIKIIVNLSGGFSLVMMLYGVYTVTTSAGNPDKLKSGKDTITNAIIGLMFILLSVFLFQFIGINILNLPGVQ